jgi:glycosyltransferase involved in cell wall biosynthesis
MRIVHFQRLPNSSNHSIERVFASVRSALPEVDVKVSVCRFESRGVFKRLYNIVDARLRQGDVNHITGDVHYLALLLRKRRTVLTVHDCRAMLRLRGLRRLLFRWMWLSVPVARCSVVSVISEYTKRQLLRYTSCPEHKIRVVPDPVAGEFRPTPKSFNAEDPIVLQIGTGSNKNLERVAEALRGVPCRLDIIGRVTERQRQALESNSVSYTEQWGLSDQQVVERYRKCDIVVFVSTYEGFGMPIIEANATGRPVVTSNIGPMPEVAGSAACLVDPFDAHSIREGILRIIGDADYRNELIARGFENVKRFQPDVVAAQYATLYREVFARS